VLQVILKFSPSGSIVTPRSRVVVTPSSSLMVFPRYSPKKGSIAIVCAAASEAQQTPISKGSARIADRSARHA
jgi:hypothetical protein